MPERPVRPAPAAPSHRPGGSQRPLPRLREGAPPPGRDDPLLPPRPTTPSAPSEAAKSAPDASGRQAPRGRPSGIPTSGPANPQPLSRRSGALPDDGRRASPDELIPGVTAGRQAASGLRRRRGRRSISTGRWIAEWLVVLTVALLVAVGVKTYLFQAFSIPSASMSPTLEEGDRVLVSKLSTTFSMPDRGDVVVFRKPPTYRPGDPDAPTHLIKRVIGLPGETISGANGKVLVDGEPLDEPWLEDGVVTEVATPIKVRPGHLLVLGDNRGGSEDGRVFGTISRNLVEGRAVATIWPITRVGGL
ncbi:MAG: signal peptidase I [Microthrixaceae bacterium]